MLNCIVQNLVVYSLQMSIVEFEPTATFESYQSAGGILSQKDFELTTIFLGELKDSPDKLEERFKKVSSFIKTQYLFESKRLGIEVSSVGLVTYSYLREFEQQTVQVNGNRLVKLICKTGNYPDVDVVKETQRLVNTVLLAKS